MHHTGVCFNSRYRWWEIIYNDQGRVSNLWTKLYVSGNPLTKKVLLYSMILESKIHSHWAEYKKERFEVAKPEEIFDFYKNKDFELEKLFTCGGGLGCNLFLFKQND